MMCTPICRLWLVIGLLAAFWHPQAFSKSVAGPVGEAMAGVFEYLYIDANEDRSSGGHTAVRIDDDIFHFLYKDDYLTMARNSWAEFQLSYRGYQNRNIQSTRLDISASTHEMLRESFLQRFLAQTRQLTIVQDTRRDVALLEAMQLHSASAIEFPGLGFFQAPGDPSLVGGRHQDIREAIAAARGSDYLVERRLKLEQQLAELPVAALVVSRSDFVTATLPGVHYPFNERYGDLLAGIRAIDTLTSGAGLSEQSLALSKADNQLVPLTPGERRALEDAALGLQQRLVALSASRRPDWGVAFLLGLARHEAIRLSLEQNRWVFVDALASDANTVQVGDRTRELIPRLRSDAEKLWLQALSEWVEQTGWHESRYAAMEIANANWQELRRIEAGGGNWRIHPVRHLPRGLGVALRLPEPAVIANGAPTLLASMERSRQQAAEFANEQMGYKLLTRNCVSELFTTVDLALAQGLAKRGDPVNRETLNQETRRRLGYPFAPNPIPYVSSDQVRDNWRVAQAEELLSLRRLYARSQYEADSELTTLLRESNTLTSRVYQRNDKDSFFIFFTDGNAFVRPPLGLINLTAALGASLVGTVQFPFDGGKTLKSGLRGALFSLPELGFQNIRKGSSTWLAPDLLNAAMPGQTPAH
jgi:hypothetical protein